MTIGDLSISMSPPFYIKGSSKALTQKRLELLHAIKTEHPSSINHLARILQRDIKNVATDVRFLEQAGLMTS